MKIKISSLFLVTMILLFGGCCWFAQYRYQGKNSLKIEINFTHTPQFLNEVTVNKLLTQKLDDKSSLRKDSLDLNMLENHVNSTPEVKNAEIFVRPEGTLSLQITERRPLFKVVSEPPFFSDARGALFAYKTSDSLTYPEFHTATPTLNIEPTAVLISTLKKDPFLARELKSITLEENQYQLRLKSYDFQVVFGAPTRIQEKIKKLKVFCAFQNVQDSLGTYQKINLSFKKQVVASTF